MLQPQQQEIADTGLDDESRVLVYHSLGSGKSLSSIAAAEAAGAPYTAVTPAALRPNFRKEVKRWTDQTTPAAAVSYNAVARGQVPTSDTLVFDEAHRLRNPDSLTTRNATALADRAKHLYLLTGSPIVNHPHDLVPLVRMLTGKVYDPDEFDDAFIDERKISPGFWGWLNGVEAATVPVMKNQDEFADLLRGHVHYHAPARPEVEQREERYETELGPEQTELYRGFWDQLPWLFRWKLQRNFPLSREEMVRLSSFLSGPRQVGLSTYPFMKGKADAFKAYQQSPKLQKAVGLMQEALAKDPAARGVAFSNFVDAGLTPYAAALQAAKIPYGVFHGGLDDAARKQVVDDYNAGRSRVLLLGPSGSEGLSLKGTRLLQLLDPHWNSARSEQAIGRGVRFDSHLHLPLEDRNVRVQRFASRMPKSAWQRLWRWATGRSDEPEDARKGAPGVDAYLEEMAKHKDELNRQFEDALKEIGSEKAAMDDWFAYGGDEKEYARLCAARTARGRGEPCPNGECCPHCGARLERGDDGDCNRCGRPWPEKEAGDDDRNDEPDLHDSELQPPAGDGEPGRLRGALADRAAAQVHAGVFRLGDDRDPDVAARGAAAVAGEGARALRLLGPGGGPDSDAGYRPFLLLIARVTMIVTPHGAEVEEDRPRPFTIAVDLDGTLAEKEEPFDPASIGDPRPGARKWLRRFKEAGARVIIFTVRGDRDLVAAWLDAHDVPWDHINENPDQPPDSSGKILADVYWDDRAIRADDLDDSGPAILAMIQEKDAADAGDVAPEDVLELLQCFSALV